jgi:hypothetical protein
MGVMQTNWIKFWKKKKLKGGVASRNAILKNNNKILKGCDTKNSI